MKRIILFLATNLAVLLSFSRRQRAWARPLADGRRNRLHHAAPVLGGDGIRGSFLSLLMSKTIASGRPERR